MFDAAQLSALAVMALVVGSIAVTITKSKIFEGLREWIMYHYAKSQVPDPDRFQLAPKLTERVWKFFHGVFTCPYCMGHWLSFGLVAWYQPRPLTSEVFLVDMGVSAFALITMAAWASGLIMKALK